MLKIKISFFIQIIAILGLIISGISCSSKKPVVMAQETNSIPVSNSNSKKDKDSSQNQSDKKVKSATEKPKIISRKEWKAKNPVGKGKIHKIKFITIHHTATKQRPKTSIIRKLKNLQNFSQSREKLASGKTKPAWLDIPYHYYIAVDGTIGEAREIKFAGDTNTSYDPAGHALIVLEGNFEIEKPNEKQMDSLKKLSLWLADKYEVPISDIKAHNDYTSTACPGKNLKKLLPSLIENPGNIGDSNK